MRQQHVSVYPGHEWSGVIIHVPHASRLIPAEVRDQILLNDAALERELDAMTDAFTDFIAQRIADTTLHRPWIVVNELSRLVIDPERSPDAREEMNAVGMGAVYTRTSDGSPLRDDDELEADELIRTYFDPYATALTDLVDERLAKVGSALIIDLHSYPLVANPYELHTDGPRPEICIGTDPFHTPESLVEIVREGLGGFDVGLDSPFAGCYVPLKHYGASHGVRAFMVELRRDLYVDDSGALVEAAVTPIAEALAQLISMLDLEPLTTCRGMGNFMGDAHFDEPAP
ncbi:N-formylglutamate amidohydrolase [Aeromicrobium sp. A1-2]|nr:N-formylglutamate amidohydrolase [Aeromicrobium sp. A1-2]